MMRMIFVNLPVKDLDASKRFFGALGFTFNPMFSDETAACMVIEENIFAMLMTPARFGTELQEATWLDAQAGPCLGARFKGRNYHPKAGEWETTSTVVDFVPEGALGNPRQDVYLLRKPAT